MYVPAGRQVRVRIFGSAREDWWFISHRLQANPVVELTGPGYFADDLGLFDWYYVSEESPHYRTWSFTATFSVATAGVYNFAGYLRNYFGTDLQKQVSAEVLGLNSLDCEAIAAFELAGPNPGLRHGESCWTACADPVSTRSGDFYDSYADIATIAGRSPALSWTRTYLSARSGETGAAFGPGWSHNWNLRAIEDTATGRVEIRQESGTSVFFDTDGAGGYTAPPRVYGTLSAVPGGGWLYERGKFERFSFDATGKLSHVEDIDGDETSLTYDTSGKLAAITDSAGRSLQVTWTADRITTITDPSTPARTVTYGYTPAGLLSTVTDVNGGVTSVAYDASNRIVSVTDPRHNAAGTNKAVVNVYDTQGRVIRQTNEAGDVHLFDYTTVADATIVTDPAGVKTLHRYDVYGLLKSVTVGYGSATPATTSYARDYNHLGITKVTDALGKATTTDYNGEGDPISVADPLGRTTTVEYNTLDLPTKVTDPTGVATTTTYTDQGRPLTISRALLNGAGAVTATAKTTFTHDPAKPEDVTQVTDPNGNVWRFTYDAAGNQVSSTAPATADVPTGAKTTSTYNTVGWPLTTTSPRGNLPGATPGSFTTGVVYDKLGQVISTIRPDGATTSAEYDANGNVVETTDAQSKITRNRYDDADRLIEITRPDGSTTATGYLPGGRVAAVTDPGGAMTSYGYDTLGRRNSHTDPLNRTTTYTRDLVGRIKTVTAPDATNTTMTYDAAGQLVSTSGVSSSSAYDQLGRRTYRTDASGTTYWTYDSLGRMTSEWRYNKDDRIDYGYDLAGNLTSIDYPGVAAGVVTRTFNAANQLVRIQDWQFREFTFRYDADGNPGGQVNPNDTAITQTFDEAAATTSINHRGLNGVANAAIANFDYVRNDNQLVTKETVAGVAGLQGPEDFGYDALDQLTQVDESAFGYDDADNLVSMLDGSTQEFDAAHQLTKKSTSVQRVASLAVTDQLHNEVTTSYGMVADSGDIAIVAVATPAAETATMDTPWVQLATKTAGTTKLTVFYKPITQDQVVKVRFSGGGLYPKSVGAALYRGVDPTAPLIVDHGTAGTVADTTVTLGSRTADARLSTRVIAAAEVGTAANKTGTWTAGAGVEVHAQAVPAVSTALALADQKLVGLGPTGSTTMTYSTSANLAAVDLVLRPAPIRFSYDQRGNRTQRTPASATATTYGYDAWNRLTNINGQTATYTYDAEGLRTAKTIDPPGSDPAVTTSFTWTTNSALPLLLTAGTRHFLYGPTGQVLAAVDPLPDISYLGGLTITGETAPALTVTMPTTHRKRDVAILTTTFPTVGGIQVPPDGFSEVTRVTSGLTTTVVWSRTLTASPLDAKDPPATVVYTPGDYDKTLSLAVYRNVDPIAPISTVTTNATLAGSTVNTAALVGTEEVGNLAVIIAAAADPLGPSDPTFTVAGAQHRTVANRVGTAQPVTMIADRPLAHGQTVTLEAVYNDVADLTAIGLVLEHARPVGHFYHGDQLGSVRAVTNEYGELKTARHYDPYGIPVKPAGTTANAGGSTVTLGGGGATVADDFGFAGEWTDAETGFQYLRARYYDPATGQFLTRDPIEATTREAYGYVGGNPLNRVDPSGLCWGPTCIVEDVAGAVDAGWDTTGGRAVSYVNDHKVGIMQGGAMVLAVAAVPASGGTSLALGVGALGLSTGAELLDNKPCKSKRVTQSLAIGGMGLGVGVLWAGAGKAAKMAGDLASADVAGRIGSAFGAGDVLTNFLPSPECGC